MTASAKGRKGRKQTELERNLRTLQEFGLLGRVVDMQVSPDGAVQMKLEPEAHPETPEDRQARLEAEELREQRALYGHAVS